MFEIRFFIKQLWVYKNRYCIFLPSRLIADHYFHYCRRHRRHRFAPYRCTERNASKFPRSNIFLRSKLFWIDVSFLEFSYSITEYCRGNNINFISKGFIPLL